MRFRQLLVVSVLLVAGIPMRAADGWTSLWNGKNLDGWTTWMQQPVADLRGARAEARRERQVSPSRSDRAAIR